MKKQYFYLAVAAFGFTFASCSDNESSENGGGEVTELSEEYYAGGKLGTSFNEGADAYEAAAPAVENQGMVYQFFRGERIFERDANQNEDGAFKGLGPLYVRRGCLYCHPSYGHGKRQTRYKHTDMGNGYLLVIYDKQTNAYIKSVAGMPQTGAVMPFKAPIDEDMINIEWKNYTDEWGNQFDDGETYSLIYPELTIPLEAFYSPVMVTRNGEDVEITDVNELGFRLESTIGIYGTGMTDAIPDDSITAQWEKESNYFNSIGKTDALNPALWSQSENKWVSYYTSKLSPGQKWVRRYTYAMSRGPLMDAAGANAIWNITNVTRSDRRYHYLDLNGTYYAKTASQDPEVQADFYTYFPEWNITGDPETDIYNYLTSKELPAEMSDDEYKALMIWHRGLAVPAARNLDDPDVQEGKKLFYEIGCTACHRPSWTTGDDNIQDPNGMFTNEDMPRYPHQKIWPYTDFVQHRLYMENDIRTGWCRTTPLWGRGLSKICTGAEDRLHDCRARNVIESIMWHGNAKSDARKSIENFRKLTKTQRDNVVKFINAI